MLISESPKECRNCLYARCTNVHMDGNHDIECRNRKRRIIWKQNGRFFFDTREEVPIKCPFFENEKEYWGLE